MKSSVTCFLPGQRVWVKMPCGADELADSWGEWPGVVTDAGFISGVAVRLVRLTAGQVLTVRLEHLRPVARGEKEIVSEK